MGEVEKGMLKLAQTINAHKGRGWAVDWCPTSTDKLVSCGEDKIACIWLTKDLEKLALGTEATCTLVTKLGDANHTRSVRHVAWSPCGKYVLLASFDGQVTLWEESKGKKYSCLSVVEGHESEVKAVAWSPSGRFFASCGRDKNVMIWYVCKYTIRYIKFLIWYNWKTCRDLFLNFKCKVTNWRRWGRGVLRCVDCTFSRRETSSVAPAHGHPRKLQLRRHN